MFDLMITTMVRADGQTKKIVDFSVAGISKLGCYFEIPMDSALNVGKTKTLEVNRILSMYLGTEFSKYVEFLTEKAEKVEEIENAQHLAPF